MSKCLATMIFLTLFATATMADEVTKPLIPMASVASFHGDETSIVDGDAVFVFGQINEKYVLQKNIALVKKTEDQIMGDSPEQPTGKEISLKTVQEDFTPLFLMRSPLFKEGEVKTAQIPADCLSNEKTPCTLNWNGQTYTLTVKDKQLVDSDTGDIKYYSYELSITNGTHTTNMTSDSNEGVISDLIWAGDMDGDGKLDMLTSGSRHYNVHVGYKLYLSSYAKKGEIFGFAGSIFGVGC